MTCRDVAPLRMVENSSARDTRQQTTSCETHLFLLAAHHWLFDNWLHLWTPFEPQTGARRRASRRCRTRKDLSRFMNEHHREPLYAAAFAAGEPLVAAAGEDGMAFLLKRGDSAD